MDPGRQAAWDALTAWSHQRTATVADALRVEALDPRDAALARELALGAVRHQRLYDHLADQFLRRGRQPETLRRAMRLACHQLFACDRIPAHAIGATTCDLLRWAGEPHLVGVANAVVRKLAGLVTEERTSDGPLGRLATQAWPADRALRHSLPQLLVDDLAPVLPEDVDAALAALTRTPPLCTRQRPGKSLYAGKRVLKTEGPWTWWADPQEALHGPVADGLAVVQDRAQGRAIEIARPRPLERVVDLCAAPGGKSLALYDIGCQVTACDLPGRITDLRAALPPEVPVIACDARATPFADGEFDLVVLDAPCSNSGVLARRPEAMDRYDRKHLDSLGRLQRELLTAATRLVKPDGRLLYSTCSLSPRENQQITHALVGWRVLAEHLAWPDAWQAGGYAVVLVRS